MIVTLDGPAGAGKSSVSRALAQRLGFQYLDTGAMYRCVAYAALSQGVSWADVDAMTQLAEQLEMDVTDSVVTLNGETVTEEIRTMVVTNVIHHVADNPEVRAVLVELQRSVAEGGNYVTEGRDQGTVVFPNAECKIFLTASPRQRAIRRQQELARRGEHLDLEQVLELQNERDRRDRERPVGALVPAADAISFDTSDLALEEVVTRLESIARDKLAATHPDAQQQ